MEIKKQTPETNRIFVHEGITIGQLTILDRVPFPGRHELYYDTPFSYLKQGHLWEVVCTCGNHKLYSEWVLSRGSIKSCGCLRRKKQAERRVRSIGQAAKRLELDYIKKRIRLLQRVLSEIQVLPEPMRVQGELKHTAAELRQLFSRRRILSRKQSQQELDELANGDFAKEFRAAENRNINKLMNADPDSTLEELNLEKLPYE